MHGAVPRRHAAMSHPFEIFAPLADYWRWGLHVQQAWSAMLSGPEGIARLQRQRVGELLAHAHAHSAFYRRHHAVRDRREPPELCELPSVDKRTLMADFDDWVTDPAVRFDEVARFISDPVRIGEPYLGRYTIWTSSGSTGSPGVFVQDEEALAIYDALLTARFPSAGAAFTPLQTLAAGGRFAMVAALGGHFAGVVSWERLRREYPWMRAVTRAFSVLAPLHELVAQLDDFRPTVLAGYPTTLLLLARERRAGRLRIRPQALWSGGETLADAERAEIALAFDCPVVDGYGASEFLNIAYDCGQGSLHVNSDWVVLEPIDARGRPCAIGERSASVLLTNLANRVQPLIRYDLGDSISIKPGRCACGSPFAAIQVEGRRDDIVAFDDERGEPVSMPPLALATVVEEGSGVHRFQLVQAGARTLRVRFETPAGEDRDAAWRRIESCLREYLAQQDLRRIRIVRDAMPPQSDPVSGKLREVLGLEGAGDAKRHTMGGRRR